MIQMKEIWRQISAGLIASVAFATTYLTFALTWQAALGVAVAIYIAVFLLIERAPEDHEVFVHENLTQNDLEKAIKYCYQAANRLKKTAKLKQIEQPSANALKKLSDLVKHIADNYKDDPRDLKHSLSFVNHYLPRLLNIVQDFESLSTKALTPESQHRLQQIGHTIQTYVPHFQSIYNACLENDFKRLELETSVLGDVMKIENTSF